MQIVEDVWRRWSDLEMAEWPKSCLGGRYGDQGTEEEYGLDEHRGQAGWMAGLRIERPNREVTIVLMSTAEKHELRIGRIITSKP